MTKEELNQLMQGKDEVEVILYTATSPVFYAINLILLMNQQS